MEEQNKTTVEETEVSKQQKPKRPKLTGAEKVTRIIVYVVLGIVAVLIIALIIGMIIK